MVPRYLKTPMGTNSFCTILFLWFPGTSKPLWEPIVFAPFGFTVFRYLKHPMKTNDLHNCISMVPRYPGCPPPCYGNTCYGNIWQNQGELHFRLQSVKMETPVWYGRFCDHPVMFPFRPSHLSLPRCRWLSNCCCYQSSKFLVLGRSHMLL